MHKLTVTLKQHTPLIHFQHDQEGATLRASEVKPKLDRCILTKLGRNATPEQNEKGSQEWEDYKASFNEGKNEQDKENRSFIGLDFYKRGTLIAKALGWLVGKGDHPALDYKIKIVAKEKPNEYLIASLLPPQAGNSSINILKETPYFAQESVNVSRNSQDSPVFLKEGNGRAASYTFFADNWDAIDKKGLMWEEIELTIFSLNLELLSAINENIATFFICTNFGTRSTKGFGSFTVDKINNVNVSIDIKDVFGNNFKFAYEKPCRAELSSIFKTIKDDYQKLKSGVNFNGYTKSILFCYAVEKMQGNPRWEKRFIKKAIKPQLPNFLRLKDNHHDPIYDVQGNMSWNDPMPYNYQYVRALLGIAEQFEFIVESQDMETQKWRLDDRKKVIAKLSVSGVERCESPLLFKVIDNTIYLIGNEVEQKILDKSVEIDYKQKNGSQINVDSKYKNSRIPSQFNLAEFMNYAMSERFNLGYTKIK